MSLTVSVPEVKSATLLTRSDEYYYLQQYGKPGFIAIDGNPFGQEQQAISRQRTPPTTKRITDTFTYSPFDKKHQMWRGPLEVSSGCNHNQDLVTRPVGDDVFHAFEGGKAEGSKFWYTGAKSGGFSGPKTSPTCPAGFSSSPCSSQPQSSSCSTLDFDTWNVPLTPFSPSSPRWRKGFETQILPDIAFSSPLQERSTVPTIPEEQYLSDRSTPLGDGENNENAALYERSVVAADDTMASPTVQFQAAPTINTTTTSNRKPGPARDLRQRYISSPSTKIALANGCIQKPAALAKKNNGGRGHRRRTQTELMMEAGIRFGYLDVPNISVVTGELLVPRRTR